MMRELAFLSPGELARREIAAPRLAGDAEALVRPLAVARCDRDRAVLRGEAPFRGPLLHWLRNHLPTQSASSGCSAMRPSKALMPSASRADLRVGEQDRVVDLLDDLPLREREEHCNAEAHAGSFA